MGFRILNNVFIYPDWKSIKEEMKISELLIAIGYRYGVRFSDEVVKRINNGEKEFIEYAIDTLKYARGLRNKTKNEY